jgi:hypothetical protein
MIIIGVDFHPEFQQIASRSTVPSIPRFAGCHYPAEAAPSPQFAAVWGGKFMRRTRA